MAQDQLEFKFEHSKAVQHAAKQHITDADQLYKQPATSMIRTFEELAERLNLSGKTDDVQAVLEAVKSIAETRRDLGMYHAALKDIESSNNSGMQLQNFKQLIKDKVEQVKQRPPYNEPYTASTDTLYTDFVETLNVDDDDDDEGAEQIDDDIAMEGGNLAPNELCPISAKPLLEMSEPVQDRVGIVYEKDSIVQYIRSKHGSCDCPYAGTSHKITERELVIAQKVVKAQKRARTQRGGDGKGKKRGSNVHEIL